MMPFQEASSVVTVTVGVGEFVAAVSRLFPVMETDKSKKVEGVRDGPH